MADATDIQNLIERATAAQQSKAAAGADENHGADDKSEKTVEPVTVDSSYTFAQHRDQAENKDFQAAKELAKDHPKPQDRLKAYTAATQPANRYKE